MANVNSYYLYQKYEKRGDQPWIPLDVYSVDGDGTEIPQLKEGDDPSCGSECMITSGQPYCVGENRYQQVTNYRKINGYWFPESTYDVLMKEKSTHCGYVDYYDKYFALVAREDGTFSFGGSSSANCLSYSTDGGATWSSPTQTITTSTITSGSKVLWKGVNNEASSSSGIGRFSSTGEFDVEGNILSLFYGDDFRGKDSTPSNSELGDEHIGNGYATMFINCTKLISAENLKLNSGYMAVSSCWRMFENCYSLIKAPELPSTNLGGMCYDQMFTNCTSLEESPILPCRKPESWSYRLMFQGCSNLRKVTCLATYDGYRDSAFNGWLNRVKSGGILVQAPTHVISLPIPDTWSRETYNGWINGSN